MIMMLHFNLPQLVSPDCYFINFFFFLFQSFFRKNPSFMHISTNCVAVFPPYFIQTMWICIVCRKKQELLIKTGEWIHSGMAIRFRELESELDGDSSASRIPSNEKKPRLDYIIPGSSRPYNGQCEVPYPLTRRSSLGLTNRPHPEREIRRQYSHDAAVSTDLEGSRRDTSYGWYNDSLTTYGDKLNSERVLPLPPSASTMAGRMMPATPSTSNVLRAKSMVESDHQQLDVVDSSELPTMVRPSSMQGHTSIDNTSPLPIDDQSNWLASTNIIDPSNQPSSHHYHAQPKQLPLVPYTGASNRSKESILTSVPSLDPLDNSRGYASRSYTSNGYHSQQTHHPSSHHTSISKGSSYYDPTFSTASDPRLRGPPSTTVRTAFDTIRNDSLSSDPSESFHGSPVHRPVHRTRSKGKKLEYQFSLSSSDEEIRSSLTYSGENYPESFHDNFHKCRRDLKREEILDAKIKKFLAVSINN